VPRAPPKQPIQRLPHPLRLSCSTATTLEQVRRAVL